MITIRYLGNAMSLHTKYEVLRDKVVVGAVSVPNITSRDLSAGGRAYAIALRDFA
jgi:hypothetical protein